jgi:LPXTG-motif cell wall-anchored protein
VVLLGTAVAPGVASAHHPVVTGTTSCRVDSWTVTWTARADADRNLNWKINAPAGYAPSGFHDDQTPFTRTATYPGTQASAVEMVTAEWSNGEIESASGKIDRPPLCPVDTTTTTTQPEVTTTTTQPEVTTTTTQPEVTTTTGPAATTTVVPQLVTTTVSVGQAGPTSTVEQSSGAATTTDPVGGQLPATGAGRDSVTIVVIALTLIGIGAVMLRLASKPSS